MSLSTFFANISIFNVDTIFYRLRALILFLIESEIFFAFSTNNIVSWKSELNAIFNKNRLKRISLGFWTSFYFLNSHRNIILLALRTTIEKRRVKIRKIFLPQIIEIFKLLLRSNRTIFKHLHANMLILIVNEISSANKSLIVVNCCYIFYSRSSAGVKIEVWGSKVEGMARLA